ncbi:MAG TPA: DUF5818 domain-containing protein [Terriglobales bacterium]|nr:DUF5818 domain-containing protein [Terriglobales bacterium]
MKPFQLMLAVTLMAGLTTLASAQTAPSQPADPTAQSPTTPAVQSPSTQAPATPPTFPDTNSAKQDQSGSQEPGMKSPDSRPNDETSADTSQNSRARVFMGTIVQGNDGYLLRAGDVDYKLDAQTQAKQFLDKNVKVMGTLDRQSNTIHVQSIAAGSM